MMRLCGIWMVIMKKKPQTKNQLCLGLTTFTVQEGAHPHLPLMWKATELIWARVCSLSLQGLCCLYLLLGGVYISPVPAPSPAHSQAASQAARSWKDCIFSP